MKMPQLYFCAALRLNDHARPQQSPRGPREAGRAVGQRLGRYRSLQKLLGSPKAPCTFGSRTVPLSQRAPLVFMALAHRMFRRSPSRINAYKVLASHDRLEALIEREWTIQVIAEILGTHRSMVSRWRHRGTGSRDRVIALALDNPVFDRSPPKQRRYGPKP